MESFSFYNPARIFFGENQENTVGEHIKEYSQRAMLIYGGGSIKRNDLYKNVVTSLRDSSVSFIELAGVMPNPRLETVRRGISLARENEIGVLLAVGGGSTIDTAKAIAAGVEYEGDVWDFFTKKAVVKKALPIGTILTLAGAGSEMSNSCVISKTDEQLKRSFDNEMVIPKFSILNPQLTFSVSPYQTACGAADILSHLMERYFTLVRQADVTDRMLEGVMKTVICYAPKAIKEPESYTARAELMWASTLAQNGLLSTGRIGDWGCHAIEHELSGEYDIAHGEGLAMITSCWMRYVCGQDINRFVQFARRVFDVDYPSYDVASTVEEGISRLEAFFKSIGLATNASTLKMDEAVMRKMSTKAVMNSPTRGRFLPMVADDIYNILLNASIDRKR